MKEKVLKICLILLVLVFAFMFVFTVFFKHTEESNYDKLSEWPELNADSYFSGEYFKGVMHWFTDHIPGRDTFIDYEAHVRALYGLPRDEEVINRGGDNVTDESSAAESSEAVSDPVESSEAPSKDPVEFSEVSFEDTSGEVSEFSQPDSDPEGDVELCNTVLVIGHRGLEVFYGNLPGAERYAGILNSLAEKLPENVTLYSMVIPKAGAYYIWQSKQFGYTANANKENIDRISELLSDKVVDVNVYNTLGVHSDEPIYYRTDHHWTALGCYYGTQVFAQKAGVTWHDLSDYEKHTREGYVGTLYTFSNNSPKLGDYPEDFDYYVPKTSYTAEYGNKEDLSGLFPHEQGLYWDIADSQRSGWYFMFMYGDIFSARIRSDTCKNGRKLLVVKDSYGNPVPQYLVDSFEEIYVVDMREYKRTITETVETYGITDVLVAECSFSAVGGIILDKLEGICK